MIYKKICAKDITSQEFSQMVDVEKNADGASCSLEELQGTIKYPQNDNIVCIYQNKIVGFITVNKNSRRMGESIYIVNVSVHRDYQKRGIAQNLIKQLCSEYIKQYSNRYVTLHVSKKNNKAINLYKKLGFKPTDAFIESNDDYAMITTLQDLNQRDLNSMQTLM